MSNEFEKAVGEMTPRWWKLLPVFALIVLMTPLVFAVKAMRDAYRTLTETNSAAASSSSGGDDGE